MQKIVEIKTSKVIPDAAAMEQINYFALERLTPDEVYVRRMRLANDQVDRDYERFSREVLEQFAQTLVGKSVLVGHNYSMAPIGRFFDARVVGEGVEGEANGASYLEAQFYAVATPQNEHDRRQIDGGVYSYVSIGFDAERLECDLCGKESRTCGHVLGRDYDGQIATATWRGTGEAYEGSIVYLGAQHGAQMVKREEEALDKLARAKAEASAEAERLRAQVAHLEETLERRERRIDELEEKAEEGSRYREELLADIARLGSLVGEKNRAAALAEALKDAPVARLAAVRGEYREKFSHEFGPLGRGMGRAEMEAAGRRAQRLPQVL